MSDNKTGLDDYFDRIENNVAEIQEVAENAKQKGGDPNTHIEPKFAEDMAERCEELVEIDGLSQVIRELEEREDIDREESSLEISRMIAKGELGNFDDKQTKVDKAIRASLALLTEGIVAAPIEGINSVKLEKGDSGQEFIRVTYAGPIRSAGGTGQALSVLVADYVRQLMDIGKYVARDDEIERSVAELTIYDEDVGLQYAPSDKEVRTIVKNVDVMLDAKSADTRDVNAYKNLERIAGNAARGGMCLTIGEGIAQKAPKLQKYTSSIDIDGWDWLSELKLGVEESNNESSDDDGESSDDGDSEAKKEAVKPSKKYLKGLIGGRPVFSHPSRQGGFRLRYGRARNTGIAASGINPASMVILNRFIATGTQLKTERPGKAQGMTPVDGIEGPTVKLSNGEVRRIDDVDEARELSEKDEIEDILDIGEMLVNYGEFLENNHRLVPASYVHEWWIQESDEIEDISPEDLTAEEAIELSNEFNVPLHPKFTYLWHDITLDEFKSLSDGFEERREFDGNTVIDKEHVDVLEKLLVPHIEKDGGVVIQNEHDEILELCCGDLDREHDSVNEAVSDVAGITIRKRCPVRIGARMGRPEKSKRREKPKFHGLVPIGREGGDQRLINEAAREARNKSESLDEEDHLPRDEDEEKQGYIDESITRRRCPECDELTWKVKCGNCGSRTDATSYCSKCDIESDGDVCPSCGGDLRQYSKRPFNISGAFFDALDSVDVSSSQVGKIKGVKRLESETKIVEPLEKAVLRSKHDILSFSDGTVRYDLSDLPVTAFKPNEVGVSVEKLRELGYEEDMSGDKLEEDDQLCELKVQDIIIHDGAAEYMLETAKFVDELLEDYYGVEPYYNVETKEDLVGELFAGLAPHTSAGVVCRLIGFTKSQSGYGHPFFHAAKRRNCFHPDTKVEIFEDDELESHDIGTFVDELFDTPSDTHDGVIEDVESEDIFVPSIDEDGNMMRQKVSKIIKQESPNHLIEIETDIKRSVRVTPNHNMLREKGDGNIERVRATEISEGDMVPAARYDSNSEVGRRKGQVTSVNFVNPDNEYVYCFEVKNTHNLVVNGLYSANCDGDEDSIMLLLDGLLNYSESYLNNNRQGWSMDRPIVMTTRIDPLEIDDEAHNVDIVGNYPLDFYEATTDIVGPKEYDMKIAEDTIEGDFTGFKHTTETSSIHAGPPMSSYKTVGDMQDKIDAQFDLAERARAVDETDVAERLINNHYLPDIRGNLRSFTQQEVRCHPCGSSYRRIPLDGKCRNCGSGLILNLHEGSVNKYVDAALEMAEEYNVDPYIRQSIEVLSDELEQIFEDQTTEQKGLGEFM